MSQASSKLSRVSFIAKFACSHYSTHSKYSTSAVSIVYAVLPIDIGVLHQIHQRTTLLILDISKCRKTPKLIGESRASVNILNLEGTLQPPLQPSYAVRRKKGPHNYFQFLLVKKRWRGAAHSCASPAVKPPLSAIKTKYIHVYKTLFYYYFFYMPFIDTFLSFK